MSSSWKVGFWSLEVVTVYDNRLAKIFKGRPSLITSEFSKSEPV